jgi:hypothetical protein
MPTCQSLSLRKEAADVIASFGGARRTFVTDAQLGLSVATPIIIAFALLLYRMGVLQGTGAISAIVFSIGIATVLFLGQ